MAGDTVKAAIYCRVSTDDQARQGYSMAAQERRSRAYADKRGWQVVGVYSDSRSGKVLRRPGYVRMLEESEAWDVLVVWKIDRIHRDAVHFSKMLAALQSAGKAFVAVYEELDSTTVYGAFAMDVIARLAQLESEQLGERVIDGMSQKIRKGEFIGPVPFGYEKNVHGQLVPSVMAPLVRMIYAYRRNGMSYKAIAERLNSFGIQAALGRKWNGKNVSNLIRNPVYAGFIRWNGIVAVGVHTAIIPPEYWEDVTGERIVPNNA